MVGSLNTSPVVDRISCQEGFWGLRVSLQAGTGSEEAEERRAVIVGSGIGSLTYPE